MNRDRDNDGAGLKRRVAIVTNNLNCERHVQYYSQLEKYFKVNGWEVAEDFEVDKVVVCGCGFHDVMHQKVLRTVETLKGQSFLESNIIVMGCQSGTHEEELCQKLSVRLIGFGQEEQLDDMIRARVPFKKISPNNIFRPFKGCIVDEKKEYFHIKIAQGCLRQCTFCVINKAKGYIRSVPPEEILAQYRKAMEMGKRRIYLMGEDTFAYGIDKNSNIIELTEMLLGVDPGVELNFGSLHIRWLLKYAEGIMSLCKRGFVEELHIGLQHVNDEILKKMGRPIMFSEVYEVIKALKRECPDLFLEADILVGFPGETEEKFKELLDFFARDRCFENVRHFGFSDVKGAPSFHFNNKLPSNEIVSRWERMDKILLERSSNFKSDKATQADIAFQLTHERDYTFCKDTFLDEIQEEIVETDVLKAESQVLDKGDVDFEF
jgi:MiaB/RimO family radical SAM methylthiotransferase